MLPVILNIKGKKAVVFGGGRVAERRIKKLLDAGAEVTVISNRFTDKIEKMNVKKIKVELNQDNIRDYIGDAYIVLALTDSTEINNGIEREAHRRGKIVNRADKVSDVIFPAAIQKDNLVIAISTLGRAPAAARLIKKEIKKILNQETLNLIEVNHELRQYLKGRVESQKDREEILREVIQSGVLRENLKNPEKAKEIAIKIVEEKLCTQ